jgi:hypothetical protein
MAQLSARRKLRRKRIKKYRGLFCICCNFSNGKASRRKGDFIARWYHRNSDVELIVNMNLRCLLY